MGLVGSHAEVVALVSMIVSAPAVLTNLFILLILLLD